VAEANLAAAQAAYDANASADLKVAVKQYRAETKKLEALKETRDAAQAEAVAQFEAFEDAYPDQSFDAVWDIEEAGGLDGLGIFVTVDGARVPLVRFEPFEGDDVAGDGRAVLTAEGATYAGLDSVVNAANIALAANDAVNV